MTLQLEGLVNFRDLGGIPITGGVAGGGVVRSGRLFRSDSLCYATDADAAHLAEVLRIATVVDLREETEVREFGRGPLERSGVGYVDVPIGDVPTVDTRSEFYVAVLANYGPAIGAMIRELLHPGRLPAVIHCHVGCDRTGAVSAAILSLLGVSEEDVAADYARSRRANDMIRQRSRDRRELMGLPQMDEAYYLAWDPRADIMATSLELIRKRWGGIDGWAFEAGLTSADIAALQHALIDFS